MSILTTLLNIILPASCVGCSRKGEYLCANCLAALPLADTNDLPGTIALFDYNDKRVRRAVWLLKYRGARSLADTFARTFYDRLLETLSDTQNLYPGEQASWLVIPVPLSKKRSRSRGFNQAAEIGRALARLDPNVFRFADQALIKAGETPTQVSIKNRADRLKNLRGAFAVVTPKQIHDQRLILIDDVTTTGATLAECAKVLKSAGAHRILKLAIAHG